MAFIHEDKFELYEIEAITTPEGRQYKVPDLLSGTDSFAPSDVLYESVTTALGKQPGRMESLREWRKRVGWDEANRISRKAAGRGTAVHSIIEDYLNNKEDPCKDRMPDAVVL